MKLNELNLVEYDVYNKEYQVPDFLRQSMAFKRGRRRKKEKDTLSGYILSMFESGKITFQTALQKLQGLRDEGEITQDEFDQASDTIYAMDERKEQATRSYH